MPSEELERAFLTSLSQDKLSTNDSNYSVMVGKRRIAFALGVLESNLWQILVPYLQGNEQAVMPFSSVIEAGRKKCLAVDKLFNEADFSLIGLDKSILDNWRKVSSAVRGISTNSRPINVFILAVTVSAFSAYFLDRDWTTDLLRVWAGYIAVVTDTIQMIGLDSKETYSFDSLVAKLNNLAP